MALGGAGLGVGAGTVTQEGAREEGAEAEADEDVVEVADNAMEGAAALTAGAAAI